MKLRHLRVQNFRCVKSLDWLLAGDFICLVGPGDCGKSTILDAIELALSPRWNPVFDDSDFHNGKTDDPIVIDATIGDLPGRLFSDASFGLRLRGLSPAGTINDEPEPTDEEVITIRLTVDASLEPLWEVVTDRHPEGAAIHAKEREQFGVARLGAVVDRHLSWSRGSVLARLTGETDEHADLLADASRKARESMDVSKVPKLHGAAQQTASLAAAFGVTPTFGFQPGLDPATAGLGGGGLTLHDGPVPVRRAGLGSRRLIALAVQREIARAGGVILVDEVEHGLEPYRVRRLLRELLEPSPAKKEEPPKPPAEAKPSGVVVLTTHSATSLSELTTDNLRIVRRDPLATTILRPSDSIRPLFRSNPEAFLSRRIIVAEGKTELGFLRGLDRAWTATGEPFAARGLALADGGGSSKVGGIASAFSELLYPTAVLADDDVPLDVDAATLTSKGILVVQWADKMALEQRIFTDLPWTGVLEAIEIAMKEHDEQLIRAQLASTLSTSVTGIPANLDGWQAWRPESELRKALGIASKSKSNGWFKRVDLGGSLGLVVARHLPEIADTDLAKKLNLLRLWIFRD